MLLKAHAYWLCGQWKVLSLPIAAAFVDLPHIDIAQRRLIAHTVAAERLALRLEHGSVYQCSMWSAAAQLCAESCRLRLQMLSRTHRGRDFAS